MKIIDCEQGSKEWHEERAGVITASMLQEVRKRLKSGANKGGFSKAAEQYAFRLAFERVAGTPLDDTYVTEYMRRGNRLEEAARVVHEARINDLIESVGMVKSDCGNYGASADGFIGTKGGAEYKCFVSPEKMMPIMLEGDLADIQDQMQMNMWLSNRDWWHFGLYCPHLESIGRDLLLIKVERDEEYIAGMKADLEEFNTLVESYKKKIEAINYNNV